MKSMANVNQRVLVKLKMKMRFFRQSWTKYASQIPEIK